MLDKTIAPDLARLGVRELTDMYADGSATPVDALNAALDQINAQNERVNAFSFVDETGARDAALKSAERWRNGAPLSPIDGITTTIKDVMMVDGWETTFGSRVLGSGAPSDWNSPAVARLLEAGAVLIGQTTTPEIGWKGATDNTRHGTTRNPWNTSKTPGGSSGGAGAAAAMGAGVLHVGTDGGGSVRLPASFCGVFGHKPSHGRVPAYPPSPYSTLANVGPITRLVEDAALMLSIMSQPDVRDWHALPYEKIVFEETLRDGVAGMHIAYSPDFGYVDVHPDVAQSARAAIDVFTALGAEVTEVSAPLELPGEILDVLWYAGITERVKHLEDADLALMDPGLLELAKRGQKIELSEFQNATIARAEFGRRSKEFFQDFDLLVTPTCPIPAFDIDAPFPDKSGRGWSHDLIPFTCPFNLTKQPACSVPCGFTADGLPIGVQLVGDMFDDTRVLQAAYAFQKTTPTKLYPEAVFD